MNRLNDNLIPLDSYSPQSKRGAAERCVENYLLSEAKLRENNKILEAHDRGEFPVDQGLTIFHKNLHSDSSLQTPLVQLPLPTTRPSEEQEQQEYIPLSATTCTVNDKIMLPNPPIAVRATGQCNDNGRDSKVASVTRGGPRYVSHHHDEKQVQLLSIANDAAIAAALQEELKMTSTGGRGMSHNEKDDYQYARQIQEKLDSEMAQVIQQQQQQTTCTSSDRLYSLYAQPYEEVGGAGQFRGYTKLAPKSGIRSTYHTSNQQQQLQSQERTTSVASYERVLSSGYESNEGGSTDDMSYEALSELEDVPNGLSFTEMNRYTRATLYNKIGEKKESPCSICFDDFQQDQPLRILPCFHKFHRHCIEKWLSEKRTCPFCLKSVIQSL